MCGCGKRSRTSLLSPPPPERKPGSAVLPELLAGLSLVGELRQQTLAAGCPEGTLQIA